MINVNEILEKAIFENIKGNFISEEFAKQAAWWYLNMDTGSRNGLLNGIKEIVEEVLKEASEAAYVDEKTESIYQGSLGNEEGLLYKDEKFSEINKQSILDVAKQVKYD